MNCRVTQKELFFTCIQYTHSIKTFLKFHLNIKLHCYYVLVRLCLGGYRERETPGPIPNPEAKPLFADNTADFICGNVGRCLVIVFFYSLFLILFRFQIFYFIILFISTYLRILLLYYFFTSILKLIYLFQRLFLVQLHLFSIYRFL